MPAHTNLDRIVLQIKMPGFKTRLHETEKASMARHKDYSVITWLVIALTAASCVYSFSCGGPRIDIRRRYDQVPPNTETIIPTTYRIGQGDELEILYHIVTDNYEGDYHVGTGDTIRIDFYYYPVMSRTVKVRPDGYVTLPKVGDVLAAGLKPSELSRNIEAIYTPHLSKPNVTVDVVGFNARVNELKKAVTTTNRGQSRTVVVRPDGMISLPFINEIHAAGLTSAQLRRRIDNRYKAFSSDISVTVAVLQALSNRAYVMGQVNRPNFYILSGPISLTQLIAQAGGFTREANTHQVVLISRNKTGQPSAQLINMNDTLGKGDMQSDPIVSQFDVIYVPRTKIAEASLVGESLWRLIPLTFNAGYALGGNDAE